MSIELSFPVFYPAARERTLRQFIEAFWCEGFLQGRVQGGTAQTPAVLALRGQDEQGQACHYLIDIQQAGPFGRLRLSGALRHADGRGAAAPDIGTAVPQLLRHLDAAPAALRQFVAELHNTALKQAYSSAAPRAATLRSPYRWQEAGLGDGHLYHPCFRSRMGFSVDDHLRYGPEFAQPMQLVWLALERRLGAVHALAELDYATFLSGQLGRAEYDRLLGLVEQQGHAPADYLLLPAHPWHWQHCIQLRYADWLADGRLLALGEGGGRWLAQQSIRSLSALDGRDLHNLKLPLGIANSSADRILSDHHVHNAPIISRWLDGVCRADPFLADGKLAILAEPIGITLADEQTRPDAYGLLGAIWRQSPESRLAPGEQVFPMTGLCGLDQDGALSIAPWLRQHGAAAWVAALLEAVVPPFLHLMMAHGVLLEGHAQNTLLILRDGLPCRSAVRDLPGGLHYLPASCTDLDALAGLRGAPAYRNALNASAGFAFGSTGEARDYLLEVLFFINLGELAHRLALHADYAEAAFWRQARATVLAYQAGFPEMAERHRVFDLLGPGLQLECLAARRLLGWSTPRFRHAANPLAEAAAGADTGVGVGAGVDTGLGVAA
ncbi:IucA/IucC family siderophore biosynthesis protein [Janthinobacterium sp. BJB412]|nr:IucA/IucC family siderophore biosynthesis protein [Janthinobacterium sp. BJB412]